MNTTSNIQNMNSVEINARIAEIDQIIDTNHNNVLIPLRQKTIEEINSLLNSYIPGLKIKLGSDYHTLYFENDTFHSIEIKAGYDFNYKTDEETWEFQMNIASCGSFSLIETTDEKEAKVAKYYTTIAIILTNEKLKNGLNNLLKNYADKKHENRVAMRPYSKERSVLENHLCNMKKIDDYNKCADEALRPEANQLYVVIDTACGLVKNAIYHKQNVTVLTMPAPRSEYSGRYLLSTYKVVKCSTLSL